MKKKNYTSQTTTKQKSRSRRRLPDERRRQNNKVAMTKQSVEESKKQYRNGKVVNGGSGAQMGNSHVLILACETHQQHLLFMRHESSRSGTTGLVNIYGGGLVNIVSIL